MDLIQEDFPATPSAVYADEARPTNSPARGTTRDDAGSNSKPEVASADGALEGVTLSLNNLYVGPGENEPQPTSPSTATAPTSPVPGTSTPARSDKNQRGPTPPPSVLSAVPTGSSLSANSQVFTAGSSGTGAVPPAGNAPAQIQPQPQAATTAAAQAAAAQQAMYRGGPTGPGGQPPMMTMVPGVGPQGGQMMPPPVQYVPMDGSNGVPGGVPAPGQGPGQPAFFMPQHVYLDPNGQPVYYRVTNPNAPYQQQELIYTGGPEGGNPGDPLAHVAYMPYPGQPYFDAQGGSDWQETTLYPINTPYQHCQPTLSATHPAQPNTPYELTLSNTPYQPTLSFPSLSLGQPVYMGTRSI